MELQDFLLESTVGIENGESCGTGFFVAPDLVLTCAHLIEDPGSGDYPQSEVMVVWGGNSYPSKVIRYAASPHPDLAVLKVDLTSHHSAYLFGPTRPEDPLFLCGYPHGGSSSAVRQTIEGADLAGDALRLEPGLVQDLDGAPLLNLRTGGVCAMLTTAGDPSTNAPGRAIGVTAIGNLFPEIHQVHDAHHLAGSGWFDCAEPIRTVHAARSQVLATKVACQEPIQQLLIPRHGGSAMDLLAPMSLKPLTTNGVQGGAPDVGAALDRCRKANHGLLIVGTTGSGRSSVLRSLGYEAASSFRNLGGSTTDSFFPILLRANQLTYDKDSVEDELISSMATMVGRPGSLPPGFLTDLAETPSLRLLIMIDGVDEIQNQRELAELVGFIGRVQTDPGFGARTQLVATSRPSAAEHFRYSNFDVYETQPLSTEAVELASKRWLGASSDFLVQNSKLLTGGFLSSPLNLAVSLKLFERDPGELPDQVVALYERLVEACSKDWKTRRLEETYGSDLMEHAEDLLGFLALELLRSVTTFDGKWLATTATRFFVETVGFNAGRASEATARLEAFVVNDSLFLRSLGDRFYWSHLSFRDYFAASCLVRFFSADGSSIREIEARWFDSNWGRAPAFALQLLPDVSVQHRIVGDALSSSRRTRLNFTASLIRDGARLPFELVDRLVEDLVVQAVNEREENGSDVNVSNGELSGLDLLLSLAHVGRAREELERLSSDEAWPAADRTRARIRLQEVS